MFETDPLVWKGDDAGRRHLRPLGGTDANYVGGDEIRNCVAGSLANCWTLRLRDHSIPCRRSRESLPHPYRAGIIAPMGTPAIHDSILEDLRLLKPVPPYLVRQPRGC
jgi:hypothetical protein